MERLLTPQQVCDLIPGMTPPKLAQLRFNGGGPRFLKPTPRTVVYRESQVAAWLDGVEHVRTNELASA